MPTVNKAAETPAPFVATVGSRVLHPGAPGRVAVVAAIDKSGIATIITKHDSGVETKGEFAVALLKPAPETKA